MIEPVLQTPNARVATWYFDEDASVYRFPWVTSTTQLSYPSPRIDAQMLDNARETLAANSTATRKIVFIGVGNNYATYG